MNHYKTLGVAKDASPENIKKAYRAKALEHHPNKGGNAEIFKRMGAAYEVLGDPAARAEYDLLNPIKKTKTVSRSAAAAEAAGAGAAGAGAAGGSALSEANAELLQRIDNARHTVVYNTKDTLEELLEEARRRGLNHRTRYAKAKNVLNSLSKKSKSKRRKTRKL